MCQAQTPVWQASYRSSSRKLLLQFHCDSGKNKASVAGLEPATFDVTINLVLIGLRAWLAVVTLAAVASCG
jgi:hypothetical protein